MTQESIFERLSPDLSREWFRYRREKGIPKGAVRFEIFADWIKDQASIELERIGSDRKESLYCPSSTTPKERPEPAYQPSPQKTTSPVSTSTSQKRTSGTGCKVCGKKDHEIALDCDKFKELTDDEKHGTCSRYPPLGKRLCIHCLNSRCDLFRDCPERQRCRRCRYDHHATIACRSDIMKSSPGGNARSQ